MGDLPPAPSHACNLALLALVAGVFEALRRAAVGNADCLAPASCSNRSRLVAASKFNHSIHWRSGDNLIAAELSHAGMAGERSPLVGDSGAATSNHAPFGGAGS